MHKSAKIDNRQPAIADSAVIEKYAAQKYATIDNND